VQIITKGSSNLLRAFNYWRFNESSQMTDVLTAGCRGLREQFSRRWRLCERHRTSADSQQRRGGKCRSSE